MMAIVGNSKCVKLAQHYMILMACCAFKQDNAGAKRHMALIWEILEEIKINKDLFVDYWIAAICAGTFFQLLEFDEIPRRVE